MIQHMNLVFQAEGLSVGEGAFLMACCNHTDDKGYVIASMQQLADEAHMKERTARENKQRLIKSGLLAAAERYHPKTGARIADLYRVNLNLLGQMQRKRTDYGPTVIEELTFTTPEETAGQTPRRIPPPPPAESAAPPADSAGGVPAESAPLLLPSSSPSSLSGLGSPSGDADPAGEREAAAPEERGGGSEASRVTDPATRVAVVWARGREAHGLSTAPARLRAFEAEARRLLAGGVDVGRLKLAAQRMSSEPTWFSLAKQLDAMPAVPAQGAGPRPSGAAAGGLSAAALAILANASGL